MKTFKLIIAYDGTDFKGWQIQNKGERTVQDVLQKTLSKILNQSIKITGSGRTDSGVHADGQVAHFKANTDLEPATIQKALNAVLPDDVAIKAVEVVKADFHAQYSAKSKIYRYQLLNTEVLDPKLRRFVWFYPHRLNLAQMKREASQFIGKKDFRAFQASDPLRKEKDTVRTVKRLEITKKGDLITFEIEANGFLYKMVRNVVGTLVEIGSGQKAEGSVKSILKTKDRTQAGVTAKPQGLSLFFVKY